MATTEERARLSRETVVDGALALTDAEGLEGLTIRRLATHLGVTPMALYWHFKNKDELLNGLVDRLWSLMDPHVDPAQPWPERLRALMSSMVEVLQAHPAGASLLTTIQFTDAGHCFDIMETALVIFEEAGFSRAQSAALMRHGLRTVITLTVGDPDLTPKLSKEEAAEFIRRKRLHLETLPRSRYPHVVDSAEALTSIDDPMRSFGFGIDLYVAGVEALAARRPH